MRLLDKSAAAALRVMLHDLLYTAARHADRVAATNDPEVLHDLRVALRRLRSVLRGYRAITKGWIPQGVARRLGKLARATSAARDHDVQRAWLVAQQPHLSLKLRLTLGQMLYQHVQHPTVGEFVGAVSQAFRKQHTKLLRCLSATPGPAALHNSFPAVALVHVTRQRHRLAHHLQQLGNLEQDAAVHRARLTAKRLRYLLEPMLPELTACAPVIAQLKVLQDGLGALHDSHLRATRLLPEFCEAPHGSYRRSLARARYTPAGILCARLAELDRWGRIQIQHELRQGVLMRRGARFLNTIDGVLEALAQHVASHDVPIHGTDLSPHPHTDPANGG